MKKMNVAIIWIIALMILFSPAILNADTRIGTNGYIFIQSDKACGSENDGVDLANYVKDWIEKHPAIEITYIVPQLGNCKYYVAATVGLHIFYKNK